MYQNPYIKIKPKTRHPYTEIYFIRHCHPNYSLEKKVGSDNMPLSKNGLKQRKFLTQRLIDLKAEVAYSSELTRSLETAETYIKKTKKKLNISPRLNEINWEHWVRIKYFNMSEESRVKRVNNHSQLDKQLDKMQAVARRTLADIYKNNRGKKILVFSHGNFIKSLITGILNADVIGFLTLEIFQSSITKLVIDRDGYVKISYINDVLHLPSPPTEDLFAALID
jgi:broad specificity phosphatase PhoE